MLFVRQVYLIFRMRRRRKRGGGERAEASRVRRRAAPWFVVLVVVSLFSRAVPYRAPVCLGGHDKVQLVLGASLHTCSYSIYIHAYMYLCICIHIYPQQLRYRSGYSVGLAVSVFAPRRPIKSKCIGARFSS